MSDTAAATPILEAEGARSNDAGAPASETKVVYVQSKAAATHARKTLGPIGIAFRSSSPALIHDPAISAHGVDEQLSPSQVLAFSEATLPFTQDIFSAITADDLLAPYAQVVTERAAQLTKLAYRCLSLTEEDFTEPRTVVRSRTGNPSSDDRVDIPWDRLLATNPHLTVIDTPQSRFSGALSTESQPTDLWTRLRFQTRDGFQYRAFLAFWNRIGLTPRLGTFFILRDNDLMRETAVALARNGFAIRAIAGAPQGIRPVATEVEARFAEVLRGPVRRYLDPWLIAPAADVLEDEFAAEAAEYSGRFDFSREQWRRRLSDIESKKPIAVLTNMLKGPYWTAFYEECKARKLPVVSFQHGHSRELVATLRAYSIVLEECASDLMINFNERAAHASLDNPFSVLADAIGVGQPQCFLQSRSYRQRKANRPPIFYVSTALQTGYRNLPSTATWSDYRKMCHELALVEEVFALLPHRVLLKPYPANRYLDEPPTWEAARNAPNIELFEARSDLRYLLPDCRIVVTSRATGTTAWCISPDRPTVYIDLQDHYPPQPDFQEALKRSVFYFSSDSPSLLEDVRNLLSQPLADIERQWESKRSHCERLVAEFFGANDGRAGTRAARSIRNFVNKVPIR